MPAPPHPTQGVREAAAALASGACAACKEARCALGARNAVPGGIAALAAAARSARARPGRRRQRGGQGRAFAHKLFTRSAVLPSSGVKTSDFWTQLRSAMLPDEAPAPMDAMGPELGRVWGSARRADEGRRSALVRRRKPMPRTRPPVGPSLGLYVFFLSFGWSHAAHARAGNSKILLSQSHKDIRQPRGGMGGRTPPPHREFKERSVVLGHGEDFSNQLLPKKVEA